MTTTIERSMYRAATRRGRDTQSLVGAALLGTLALFFACREDAPPPPPEPAKCARVAKNSDDVVETPLCANKDGDNDGVDDAVDHCPDRSESKNGTHDLDGCPDPDADDDGLVDEQDGCPKQAGPPPDGCPLADKDGDGIADHLDACPTQAEDVDGENDSDGCPEGENLAQKGTAGGGATLPVVETRIAMLRGRATPTPQGARDLAQIVDETARDVSVVERVQVVGRAGLNEARRGRAKPLAEERAAKVRAAFQRAGLPASRIEVTLEPLGGDAAEQTGDVVVRVVGLTAMTDGGVPPSEPAQASEPAGDAGPPMRPQTDDDWDRGALDE